MIEDLWLEMQSELAAESGQSAHIVAADSGHHIHIDQPGLVSYAVALLTDRYRIRRHDIPGSEQQALSNRSEIDFGAVMWLHDSLFEEKKLTSGYDND